MDARSTKSRLERRIWRCRCLKSRKGANVLKNENSGEDLDGLRSLESCSLDKRPAGTSAGDGRQGKIPWSSDSSNPVEYSGEIFMTRALYLRTSTQAPATHPNGVGVAGQAKMLPEASQLPPIPFFSAQNIKVKVSLC